MTALLSVDNLKTYFPIRAGLLRRTVNVVRAVDGVSFEVRPNETLGLVGESGCGKSTVGRTIMYLLTPTEGEVSFDGHRLGQLSRRELIATRLKMQMIFQNPTSSLNPRMTVEALILSFVDDLDAKLNITEQLRRKIDGREMAWSEYQRSLERFLYLGGLGSKEVESGPENRIDPGSRQPSLF